MVLGRPPRTQASLFALALALTACGSDPTSDHSGTGGTAGSGGGSAGSGGAGPGSGGSNGSGGAKAVQDEAAALFGATTVPAFELTLPPEQWESLKAHAVDEQFTEASLSYEGKAIGSVGLRFKGSVGTLKSCFDASGKQTCPKLSMKLKFNEYSPDLRFYGLKRLNLHSMVWDPTKLHDRLAYDMFRELGIETPRSAWANVKVNGASLGLFAMVEQVDGAFAKSRWPEDGEGNVFKEVWPGNTDPNYYTSRLETNETTGTAEAFLQMTAELKAAAPEARTSVLGKWTDLTSLYNYMAVDDAVMDWDGVTAYYTDGSAKASGNHNYYWYQEPATNQFHLIPWDKDATFTPQGSFAQVPRWNVVPDDCSKLYPVWDGGARVIAPGCTPTFQALASDKGAYQAAVDRLLAGPFAEETVLKNIDRHAAFIEASVGQDPLGPSVAAWKGSVAQLKAIIPVLRTRLAYLREGRAIPPFSVTPTVKNDFEGVEALSLAFGSAPYFNASTRANVLLNTKTPLEGKQDLRIDFAYGNEAIAWQQYINYGIVFAEGTQDISQYQGIRLKIRSDKNRVVRLELNGPAQTAANQGIRLGWTLNVGSDAQDVDVKLLDAGYEPWVAEQNKDPKVPLSAVLTAANGIQLFPQCANRGSTGFMPDGYTDEGYLEVDSLEFYKTP